jgi:hypothetical protein
MGPSASSDFNESRGRHLFDRRLPGGGATEIPWFGVGFDGGEVLFGEGDVSVALHLDDAAFAFDGLVEDAAVFEFHGDELVA